MDLQQLAYFVAVAEEGSFTRGAEREHVVQSTVSAAIGRLEHELAQSLFRRTAHRITLTDAGALLLDRSRTLLAAARDLREELLSSHEHVHGSVSLGTVLSTGTLDLAGALADLRREHPDVQVRVRMATSEYARQLERVTDGTDDLALLPEPDRPAPGVHLTPVGRLDLVLTAAVDAELPQRTLSRADLADRAFVDFPPGWPNRLRIDEYFATAGIDRDVTLEVADAATAIDLVRGGLGLAFLPRRLVAGRSDVRVVPVDPPPPSRVLVLARPNGPQRPAVDAVHRVLARPRNGPPDHRPESGTPA